MMNFLEQGLLFLEGGFDSFLGPLALGDLMLKVTTTASARHNAPMVLHADCFQLWNEERRLFKSSPDPGPRHHRTQP